MTKIMLWIDIGSVEVNEFSVYFLAIIANESVLFVAFVKFKMLLE
jgi:hypothetical protein